MDYKEVKEKYKFKNYTHFDKRANAYNHHSYISNPNRIKQHAFYPLIHYEAVSIKYSKEYGKKEKVRDIYYSSHIDRYIYQYYAYYINKAYNKYAIGKRINNVSTAYRTNLGKTNIHCAKEVFLFLKNPGNYHVIVGDFESFFDKLGHSNLKMRLLKVLEEEKINDDVYAVFKSLTKFAYVEYEEIKKYYINFKKISKRKFKGLKQYFEEEFNLVKNSFLKCHKNSEGWINYGIPQGTPISGCFANVYMIDFDEKMMDYANRYNGLYRRYSDDFIIIINKEANKNIACILDFLHEQIASDGFISIQRDKLDIFSVECNKINKLSVEDYSVIEYNSFMDYLGFSFDGICSFLREKTLMKYYRKAYRYIDGQADIQRRTGKRRSKQQIMERFTDKDVRNSKGDRVNFVSYVKKCESIMNENIELFDDKGFLDNHRKKIIKRLSNKKNRFRK